MATNALETSKGIASISSSVRASRESLALRIQNAAIISLSGLVSVSRAGRRAMRLISRISASPTIF
jgi:hypothetical protein